MNRKLFTALALCAALSASATMADKNFGDILSFAGDAELSVRPIQPSYLKDVVKAEGWKSNWFAGVSAGASNFLGSPLGCDDMFGRLKPAFRANVGKWFTPTVGSRVAFEGFDIKAADLTTQGYRSCHLDLMWNVAPMLLKTGYDSSWGIIPFFGVGFAHNAKLGHTPFAISYGVIGQYKVTDRLCLTAELSNITTSKCFDGHSRNKGLGDNIFGLTAGVSFAFGNIGWKGVVDAIPYMAQNDLLLASNHSLKESNRNFERIHSRDVRVINELKKILRIEGIIEKYGNRIADLDAAENGEGRAFPKNDYSGLNSLMARIRDGRKECPNVTDVMASIDESIDGALFGKISCDDFDEEMLLIEGSSAAEYDAAEANGSNAGTMDNYIESAVNDVGTDVSGNGGILGSDFASDMSWSEYVKDVWFGRQCIGAPVFFFFNIGTAKLTDESQMINISEIARIAVKHNLKVKVMGAADSATGTEALNLRLSNDRAKLIADELKDCGVPESRIIIVGSGGIDAYEPKEANRHTKIELYR